MSIVKVWDGTAWQSMDDSGPVGDQGVIGDKGPSTRISNCVQFSAVLTDVPDGTYEPTGLTVAPGTQGVQPCMVVSGGNRLAAVKAGVYMISLAIGNGANVAWDNNNYSLIERTVARDGETRLASGDIPYGGFNSVCSTLAPLNANEIISFFFQKASNGNATVWFTIRAVMMQ